jgi:predicted AAA+ superfamily ATPase
MERSLQQSLITWKNNPNRLPLILHGAWQVGKTYIMKWLGQQEFDRYAYFNFDERPELNDFFKLNKDVDRIINALSLIGGTPINDSSLLILDEIQECPEALNTLKYFAEKRPEIPIICAGSLLGISLNSGSSFPVGKVSFLSLFPMTFREVLPNWRIELFNYLEQINSIEPLPSYFFNDLLDQFKIYLVTGGMPAVINSFNDAHSFETCENVLQNLILSYHGDFAKHPIMSDVAKIGQVFNSLPSQLARENKKFIYQLVRTGARAREYEDAIQWLNRSGMVHQINLVSKPAIPMHAYIDLGAFKLYAFDVGIMRKMAKLSPLVYSEGNRLFTEFKGAMIENYIVQSLIAQFSEIPTYWTSGNSAEVDFLLEYNNQIIPVEVKSDENIKSRSLQIYNQKYSPKLRIRYSLKNLSYQEGLLNIPHFMSDYTKELVDLIMIDNKS